MTPPDLTSDPPTDPATDRAATAPGTVAAGQDWTPVAVPALYDVRVGHTRSHPLRNSFDYGGYLWLVDLADLPRLPRGLRWAARFRAADHLGDPAASILANVVRFAALHGVPDVHRVLMLANARSGPHVFNPLSTHYCYRADGTLACIVAEVHNTYGERHAYLLHPDRAGRTQVEKGFYVSPFNTVDGRYLMRFSPPGSRCTSAWRCRSGAGRRSWPRCGAPRTQPAPPPCWAG